MTLISHIANTTMALFFLAVFSAPLVAMSRGIHDQLRWNVSWWKRPVIVVCLLAMYLGLGAISRIIDLTGDIIPLAMMMQIPVSLAVIVLLYWIFKTSYFDRAKQIKVWWKLATRKKSEEVPFESPKNPEVMEIK